MARLINDTTKFISRGTQVAVSTMTVYEKSGRLVRNADRLAKAVQGKMAKLQLTKCQRRKFNWHLCSVEDENGELMFLHTRNW